LFEVYGSLNVALEGREGGRTRHGLERVRESDVAARKKTYILTLMQTPPAPVPDPTDSEVRLATEKIFPKSQQRVLPIEGIRLMQERIADLEQKITGWNQILEQSPSDETARKCLAADMADLRDATARLREYQLQSESQN